MGIEFITNKSCTGCTACYSICPTHSISMIEEKNGFLYPTINHDTCISCMKCVKSCPLNRICYEKTSQLPTTYLAKISDDILLQRAASGGVFLGIAMDIIKQGGIVYGAVFDSKDHVSHIGTTDLNMVFKMAKSKYVQSDLKNSFRQIKKNLDDGKLVLFSGMTCQVYGLKSYLGKDYLNLICIDLVCHGIPSPGIFKDYLNYLEQKKGKVNSIVIREKDIHKNFYRAGYGINYESGKYDFESTEKNLYGNLFLNNLITRESCFDCHFKKINRISDITVGDCWFSKQLANITDDLGISLVLVHSTKGEKALRAASIKMYQTDAYNAIKANGGMIYSSAKKNAKYDELMANYQELSFDEIAKKYYSNEHTLVKGIISFLKDKGVIPDLLIDAKQNKEYLRRCAKEIPEGCIDLVTFKSYGDT